MMSMKKKLLACIIILLWGCGILAGTAIASEPFLGEIKMFGGNFAPRGYALCDGQLLYISENTALFAILGTTYGGDGRTTFALPDLRGRVAIHPGSGPGLSTVRLGEMDGAETKTLSVNEMPMHTHQAMAVAGPGNQKTATGNTWATGKKSNYSDAAPDVDMNSGAIEQTGGNQPFSLMQPYLGINYIIALQGLFPSRS